MSTTITNHGKFVYPSSQEMVLTMRTDGAWVRFEPGGEEVLWDSAIARGFLMPFDEVKVIEDGRRIWWEPSGVDG